MCTLENKQKKIFIIAHDTVCSSIDANCATSRHSNKSHSLSLSLIASVHNLDTKRNSHHTELCVLLFVEFVLPLQATRLKYTEFQA